MIKSFADKHTKEFFIYKKSRKLPPDIKKKAYEKLEILNRVKRLEELAINRGNRLEKLEGNYKGMYSISINLQYRIVFDFINGNAYEVEIIDYHK